VKNALVFAAALAAVPGAALANESTFTHDSVTYVYSSETRGKDTVITGKSYPGGTSYTLTVRGKQVWGRVNGAPVSFSIAKPLARPVETAQR
jgi:hypothetical protein